jgi:hypothetical protein
VSFQLQTRDETAPPLRRVSLTASQICTLDAEPPIKARMLRELAAWYRETAQRAGSPVIWEARLLTAEDLEAEADRIEAKTDNRRTALSVKGSSG